MLIGIDIGRKNTVCATPNGSSLTPSNTPELLKILRASLPVGSCAAAVAMSEPRDITREAKRAGFDEVFFVSPPVAVAQQFGGRVLVLNWGVKVDVSVVERGRVLESQTLSDAGGDEFDKLLSEWLMLRVGERGDAETNKKFCSEAEKIKIALSSSEICEWRVPVERGDFERLIRFHARRVAHLAGSLYEKHKCENFFVHGGGSKIPLVRKILIESANEKIIFGSEDCVAKGAAKFEPPPKKHVHKFDELEVEIRKISNLLTPSQSFALFGFLSKARTHQSTEIAETIKKTLGEISRALRREPS